MMAYLLFWCIAAAVAPPQPEDLAIRQKLQAVYSRPEFQPNRNDKLEFPDWLQRFASWLRDFAGGHRLLFWGGLIALTVLLALLLFYAVQRAQWFSGRRRKQGGVAASRREQLSKWCRSEADRLAALGDFTEAIRHLFLSLVYRFDESGRVGFQRAYTNREYLTLFHDRPTELSTLAVFVDVLDERWYGERPSEREQYEACLQLYEGLT